MDLGFGGVAVVDDDVAEDGDFVVGDGDVGERDGGEGEAYAVVAEGFGLDDGRAAGDADGDGNVQGVCGAGAGGCAGDLVDGEGVAGALGPALDEHVGGAAVPVYGASFEFVHAALGAGDGHFVRGWETEIACWATDR